MKKFRCILSDPPWRFNDQGWRISPEKSGHYRTMTLSSIIGLGDFVRSVTDESAHLWLCCPNSFVIDCVGAMVARSWGFRPVQMLTWCKPRIGVGHWMRNTTEQILLCVRGRLGPLSKSMPTHFTGRAARHSEKPEELYQHIELTSPGPRLEMFARRARDGWRSWGNESPEETRI